MEPQLYQNAYNIVIQIGGNDMGHKKYYGYMKPQERYSIKFRDDAENGSVEVGTPCIIML